MPPAWETQERFGHRVLAERPQVLTSILRVFKTPLTSSSDSERIWLLAGLTAVSPAKCHSQHRGGQVKRRRRLGRWRGTHPPAAPRVGSGLPGGHG